MEPATDPRLKPPCERDDALAVLTRLRDAGHVAYFAGGCVRDELLGLTPKDYDVATDAPPQRVQALFRNTQAVGAAFGVILVRRGGSQVEVATFRADGAYEDGRRPNSVRFTTAEEDARRRDFTVNALFFDPLENRVIDYVNGRADLEARLLRAVGDPAFRFEEDYLRLMRAVRFAARFGLAVEPTTAAAIRHCASKLRGISPERVGDELRLMLAPTTTRAAAWRLLWAFRLVHEIFRFLPADPGADLDAERSIFLALAPAEPISFGLALAAAALEVRAMAPSKPTDLRPLLTKESIRHTQKALRLSVRTSNEEADDLGEILAGIEPLLRDVAPGVAAMKRFLAQTTSPGALRLLDAIAAAGFHRDRIADLRPRLDALRTGADVAPAPLLTGDDLSAAGLRPGPAFKRILDAVYDAQLEGRVTTRDAALEMGLQMGNGADR